MNLYVDKAHDGIYIRYIVTMILKFKVLESNEIFFQERNKKCIISVVEERIMKKYIESALFLVSLKINYIHEVEVLSILIATLAILILLHAVPV